MTALATAETMMLQTRAGVVAATRLGATDGPRVLLVGGNLGEAGTWRWQVPELRHGPLRRHAAQRSLAAAHWVGVFDGRGCGASPAGPPPSTVTELANDALDVGEQLFGAKHHLVGYSLGAAVALHAALIGGKAVQSLTLIAGSAGGAGRTAPDSAYFNPPPGDEAAVARYRVMLEFSRGARRRLADVIEHLVTESSAAPSEHRSCAALAYVMHDLVGDLHRIQTPVLIVGGDEDVVVPPDNARFLADHLPNAELVLLAGVGHAVPIEVPDRSNELIAHHARTNDDGSTL